jgi:hypothetical protein
MDRAGRRRPEIPLGSGIAVHVGVPEPDPNRPRAEARNLDAFIAALSCAALVLSLLVVVGQPIRTADFWWHLHLGEQYATHGPWLTEDPLLHTATGPPAPAAWLSGIALHAVHSGGAAAATGSAGV